MFLTDLQKRFKDLQAGAGARMVFSDVVDLEGRKVITVATVRYGFGMGGGVGPRLRSSGPSNGEGTDTAPSGGGGGGGAQAEPVAVIELADGQVRIHPIVNVTRVAVLGMLTAAWCVFWVTRTIRVVAHARTPR